MDSIVTGQYALCCTSGVQDMAAHARLAHSQVDSIS